MLLACLAFSATNWVRAQGVIRFANDVASGINAPFFDVDGVTRLAGSTYLAVLYAAPGDAWERLEQVGAPRAFGTGPLAGFWTSSNVLLPFPSPTVWLQVRFWDSQNGAYLSFVQAEAAGAKIGVSVPILVSLNPPPATTPMTGLRSASLMPTIILSRGAPGVFTDLSTAANGTQLASLCGIPVGTNRWFRLTSPYAGQAVLTTAGSSVDTVMSAFTGSIASPSMLTPITCNDNSAPGLTASEVQFSIEANTLYFVCVAGKNGATGTIQLQHTLATRLRVRRLGVDGIELSWPADATNFVAESTTGLHAAAWQAVTNMPQTTTNRKVLNLDCRAAMELYRLRLQTP